MSLHEDSEDSEGSDSLLEFDGDNVCVPATHAVGQGARAPAPTTEAPQKRVRRPRRPQVDAAQAQAATTSAAVPSKRPTARSKGDGRRASSKSDMAQDDPILHGGSLGDSDDLFEYGVDDDDAVQAEQRARSTNAAAGVRCARHEDGEYDDELMFGESDDDTRPGQSLATENQSVRLTSTANALDAPCVRPMEAVTAPVAYECVALTRLRAHVDTLRGGGLDGARVAELLDAMTVDVDAAGVAWAELRDAHESNLCVVRNAVQRELAQIECRIAAITDRVQQVHGSTAIAGAVAGLKALELASTALCPREVNAVQRVGRLDNATARVDMLDTARVCV